MTHFFMARAPGPVPNLLSLVGMGGILLLVFSCASGALRLPEDQDALREEARRLKEDMSDPPSLTGQRRLGAVYVRLGAPDTALTYLEPAYSQDLNDPMTIYFYGLAHEQKGNSEKALSLYSRYDSVSTSSRFRDLLQSRHEWLRYQMARKEMQEQIKQNVTGQPGNLPAETVGVLPLSYQGSDSTYAPLGRGIGELLITDLSHVDQLRVVERIRLQALLSELSLARQEYIEPSTAPHVGRLLQAGRLVGGSYDVREKQTLQVQLSVVALTGEMQTLDGGLVTEDLSELFRLENQLVFDVLDKLDVEPTAEARAAIEQVPTRSLRAFLAYSRGLLDEDRGQFALAAQHFQKAVSLDPDFTAAVQKRSQARQLSKTDGSPEQAAATGASAPTSPIDRTELRQGNLSDPGTTNREPAGESTSAAEVVLDEAPSLPSREGGS